MHMLTCLYIGKQRYNIAQERHQTERVKREIGQSASCPNARNDQICLVFKRLVD